MWGAYNIFVIVSNAGGEIIVIPVETGGAPA